MSLLLLPGPMLLVALTVTSANPATPPSTPVAGPTVTPGGPSVRIQLRLPKERLVAAENLNVRISLRNEGTAPIELPDPFRYSDESLTYTVTGPEYPQGYDVTYNRVSLRDLIYPAPPKVPPRVQLGSGQALESTIPLHEWAPVNRPGRYRLTARLEAAGLTATSAPVEFDVVPSRPGQGSLGLLLGGGNYSGIRTAWLQETEGQSLLMLSGHVDESDECGRGVSRRSARVLGPVEPGSTDVLVPWSNDIQGVSSVIWMVWRNASSLQALAPPATTTAPFRFDLGAPPERIIRPPLETSAGELFVPVVDAGGRDLRLIRFQSALDATEVTPGREVGRVRLPKAPVAARATLQPSSLGNGISVVLVDEVPGGLDLHHVRTMSKGRLTRVSSTLLRGLRAMPDSEPDVWIDTAGRVHAGLVAVSAKNPRQALLAEVQFRPDGRLEAPARVKPLAELPAAPRAAVARYRSHPDAERAGGLSWAILLEDGSVVRKNRIEHPVKPTHPVTVPMEMMVLLGGTVLLTTDPVLGPSFEWL